LRRRGGASTFQTLPGGISVATSAMPGETSAGPVGQSSGSRGGPGNPENMSRGFSEIPPGSVVFWPDSPSGFPSGGAFNVGERAIPSVSQISSKGRFALTHFGPYSKNPSPQKQRVTLWLGDGVFFFNKQSLSLWGWIHSGGPISATGTFLVLRFPPGTAPGTPELRPKET